MCRVITWPNFKLKRVEVDLMWPVWSGRLGLTNQENVVLTFFLNIETTIFWIDPGQPTKPLSPGSWARLGIITLFCEIYYLFNYLIIKNKEGIFNIKFRDMPLKNQSYNNKSTNSSHFCNWDKCLLIIHTILLRVSFCNQPRFVSFNRPIIISLDLIHLTTTNNTLTRR